MTGPLAPVLVSRAPQRIQTSLAPGTGFLLVNTDLVNPVYIGNDPGSQAIPVPPLGSVALTTSRDLWVSTNGGAYTVNALLLPGGSQWSPSPAQIAAQIQALGLATSANQAAQIATQATAVNQATQNGYLAGTTPGALVSAAGLTVAKDMLHANAGVTTELAALLATGSPAGAAGGMPLLRYTNQVGTAAGTSLPAGGPAQTLVNQAGVTQPGYEGFITAWFPNSAGVTIPFISVVFTWIDSSTGYTVKAQYFTLTTGANAGAALYYYLNGPCYGDKLIITALNLDPAVAADIDWVINQTSHLFQTDKIVQPVYATTNAPPGFTNPNGVPGLGVIATVVVAVAASSSLSRLMAVYSGKVLLSVDNLGGANACRVRLLDPSNGVIYGSGSANQSFHSAVIAAAGTESIELGLPRGPVVLELHNQGASGAISPSCTVTALDY